MMNDDDEAEHWNLLNERDEDKDKEGKKMNEMKANRTLMSQYF